MKRTVFRRAISVMLAMFIVLCAFPILPANAAASSEVYDLTVSGTDQQTVKGWGVFPSWNRADWTRNFIDKTGAQDALFNDLGVNMFRVMIPPLAGDGNGNLVDAKMQEISDLIQTGETRGLHDFIISVWSPPIDMKTIPTVNGWTGSEHVRLKPEKEDAYTSYLVRAIQWLTAHGASVPKALSFQNEPLSQIVSEWCYWGGDNGMQYQRVAKLLRSKLDAAGLTNIQILAPEGAAYFENELLLGQNFSALSADPALNNAIGAFTSHSYFSKGYDTTEVYRAYVDALDHFPEKDRWETEYSTLIAGVSDIDMAINASRRLSSDMAFIRNNYWFWWLGWAANRHPSDVGEVLLDGDGYTVTKSKTFYVLSKIFNNVPAGSKVRRISADPASGLTTADSVWMDGVAFVNGNKTVALVVNPTDQAKTVNVKGLTGSTASVYQTTSDIPVGQDMKTAATRNVLGGTASDIQLPAKSVSVVVTSTTDTAAPHITFDQANSTSTTDAGYAVRSSQFTVSGHLDEPGTLLINGEAATMAGDLSFSKTVTLQPGMNTISAVATDTLGNAGAPQQLTIRYDSAYLGLTLDQSGLIYVNQNNYAVTGRTNGNAMVTVKQQVGGSTVSQSTYNIVTEASTHQVGDTIRQIINDNYVSSSAGLATGQGGFSVNSQVVWDSSTVLTPAEGAKSLRLKLTQGLARVGLAFVDTANKAKTEDYSAAVSSAGLQFWVYTKRNESTFSAVLESDNNGTIVESRVPLSNYLTPSDYGNKWVKVTIPLSAFDAAVHYDVAGEITNTPILWNQMKGIGFLSNAATYYDPNVDDIKIVYTSVPSTTITPPTFSAGMVLSVGENVVNVMASNELGQQAAPASVRVVYDPAAPVLTVPATGSTTSTSYVLNGSVDENVTIKVNGVPVTLKADNTFTAVVPVTKGVNTITVVAEDLAGNVTQSVVSVTCNPVEDGAVAPGVAVGNKTVAAPTIDGNIAESGWIVNNRVERMITGTSDNNITFGTMWDADKLYVAVKVLDADLKNDSEQSYQDDSVEIYIDGDNSRSTVYGSDDHQITLGWHDEQLSVGGNITGITYAQQDIAGGFTVEMAIPWSGIGIAPPKVGSVVGFDVAYNDDDGRNSGNRESQLMWRGTGDNWRSTAAFGSLYLNDGKNVTVAREPSGALTTDGALDEPYWSLRSNVTRSITGSSNNSVRFGTLGDSQNLYVGIEVLDTDLKNDSAQSYQDDSVEVYIDADHNQSTAYDAKDHQITLGWHDSQLSMIGNIEGIQYAQRDINGGYSVEMAVPWASLGITPARDISLGFDVGVNDDDGHNGGNRESQMMWNGNGDNWQNTSAFGHLLVHNLSLSLPVVTVPEPEGLVEFTDDNSTLNKVYAKTGAIAVQTSHPENFANDAASFIHINDNPVNPEYVIYKSPYGNIYSFDIATGLYSTTPQFTFYGSADGVSFTPITVKSKVTGGANSYSVSSNTASGLPAGTQYLKIVFPGKLNWYERLLNVSFKYFAEPTLPEDPIKVQLTDDAVDLSKLYDKSAHIVKAVATTGLDKYGFDATQFRHTNDDIMDQEYVVYKSPANDIYSFDINASAWTSLPSTVGFSVYGSGDGVTYTKLTPEQKIISSSNGFNTLQIKADSIARGIRYLKVVFPYGDVNCDNWTATINKVSFVYGMPGADIDKTALSAAIESAQSLHEADYTPATWAALSTALNAASAVNSDADATQEQVDAAEVALQAAIAELAPQVQAQSAGLSGPASVQADQTLDVTYSLHNVTSNVYAKEVTVNYDPAQLEFVSATSLLPDSFNVVGDTELPGSVRILEASTKPNSAVTGSVDLLTLRFHALIPAQTVTSTIAVSNIMIADQDGNRTQLSASPSYEVQIVVLQTDKTALTAALTAAQTAASEAKVYDELERWGYYPQTALDTLNAAITSANTVLGNAMASQTEIDAAAASLTSALQTFSNSVSTSASVGELAIIASHYGATTESADWAALQMYDLNSDGKLDIADLVAMAHKILD
ncbi:sugar-binding protein [Paenibacillus oryzisoli]|uniref:sugar-binding protein n=1 Tax=Paenibacillus oryzisoli TaxID=1850517 RepID=UPI003D278C04